jgi:adenylyltransferase/sulfurtransferase
MADQLVRAGVGWIRIVDRDIVEWTNLQRQVLFDESDAQAGTPKALAAAERLRRVNSEVTIDPQSVDLGPDNIEVLLDTPRGGRVDLILDGTDNLTTRFLLNDVSVKHAISWVYGGCVGTEGRVLAIAPGRTPCLSCIFPDPPDPATLPTCDTAGVLGPAACVVGSLQATMGLRLLLGELPTRMIVVDLWQFRFHAIDVSSSRRTDCPVCVGRDFSFLKSASGSLSARLCGRDTVQIRPPARATPAPLAQVARRLSMAGRVTENESFVRCAMADEAVVLTVFPDGRMLVHGTSDANRAASLYARYLGQ